MHLYIYSDESGVFDKAHNDLFVFGGLVFLSKEEKDLWSRKYLHAEQCIKKIENMDNRAEVKATAISNKSKNKLYRALRGVKRFGVIVRQKLLFDRIFSEKKSKQRFLDYAYKIAVKRKFQNLIRQRLIAADTIEALHFFVDEHTTATNGKYELREGLEQEFRFGTYNYNYSKYFDPLFPYVKTVDLKFCNSCDRTLIRAADIVANKLFYYANKNQLQEQWTDENLFISYLP